MRVIQCRWNDRNVSRIIRWLKLECDWAGFISRKGQIIGHKTAKDGRYLRFVFY